MILSPDDLTRCNQIAGQGAGRVKPIVDAVADAIGLQPRHIYGMGRKRQLAEARQLVMYLASQAGVSASDIGRALHRDHSTVLHGIKREAERRSAK